MKHEFDDKSYIKVYKNEVGDIIIVIAAKDTKIPNSLSSNTVKLTQEQWITLISDIN